jgi:DNA (cytosine-5)-methyltransferase 1
MSQKLPLVAPNGYTAIDTLCGAGGMTLAQHLAGFTVKAALNHWQLALDSQAVHFPLVPHFCADVRTQHADALGKADYFHMSPDCRHHSRAKGGKPVDPSVRALAEEAPRYLLACDAKVATFENVPEFVEWGPERLKRDADGKVVLKLNKKTGEMEEQWEAIPERKGEYYDRWVATLRAMGFVNHKKWIINSADYGSAQARRRYFGVFTRAGIRITRPKPTHDQHGRGGLPKWRGAIDILEAGNYGKSAFESGYVENTLNRLAAGVEQYGGQFAPWLMKYNSNPPSGKANPGFPASGPLHTLACQRTPLVVRPLLLHPYYKSGKCIPLSRSLQTLTTKDRFGIASAVIPLPTLLTKSKFAVASTVVPAPGFSFDHQFQHQPRLITWPLRTMVAGRRYQYIGVFQYFGLSSRLQLGALNEWLRTITTGAQARLLSALYEPGGPGEKVADQPGDTPAMLRLKAACRKHGIIDLLVRMLTVRESFRGQGFPDWYTLLGSETDQRKMIGNAVEVNAGLAVASEVRRMLDRFTASGKVLAPLKLRPVSKWEQSELFTLKAAA